MSDTYTAVGLPWNGGWEVVLLDLGGTVVATGSATRASDVEAVGRSLLRAHLPWRRRPARLSVECRHPAAAPV